MASSFTIRLEYNLQITWKWAWSVRAVSYVQMRKSAPFQIAGKLRGTLTDNSFKRVQIAYLGVIGNLDKLVQPSYTLSWQI